MEDWSGTQVGARQRRQRALATGAGVLVVCVALVGGVWSGALGSGDDPTVVEATVETPSPTAEARPAVAVAPGARVLLVPIEVRPVLRELAITDCATGDADAGTVPAADGTACYELGAAALTVTKVRDLSADLAVGPNGLPTDGAAITLTLTELDRTAFSALTAEAAQADSSQVALVVGDVVYSAPTVQEQITGGRIGLQLDPALSRSLVAALTG